MIKKRLIVKGRVQDVDYRETVKVIARSMKILGNVRTLKDGTVEILCQCKDEKQLEEFKGRITIKDNEEYSKPFVEDIDDYPLEEDVPLGFFYIYYGDLQKELLKKMDVGLRAVKSMDIKLDKLETMDTKLGNMGNKICESDKKCGSIAENLGYLVEIFAEAFKIDLKELKKK